jgi:hypothetical protein
VGRPKARPSSSERSCRNASALLTISSGMSWDVVGCLTAGFVGVRLRMEGGFTLVLVVAVQALLQCAHDISEAVRWRFRVWVRST